jgi:hypothetical protein
MALPALIHRVVLTSGLGAEGVSASTLLGPLAKD